MNVVRCGDEDHGNVVPGEERVERVFQPDPVMMQQTESPAPIVCESRSFPIAAIVEALVGTLTENNADLRLNTSVKTLERSAHPPRGRREEKGKREGGKRSNVERSNVSSATRANREGPSP